MPDMGGGRQNGTFLNVLSSLFLLPQLNQKEGKEFLKQDQP